MKLIFSICTLLCFFSTSCAKLTIDEIGGTTVVCQFPNMSEHSETPEYILEVLKERVSNIDKSLEATIIYNEQDTTFTVELPSIETELADLFFFAWKNRNLRSASSQPFHIS